MTNLYLVVLLGLAMVGAVAEKQIQKPELAKPCAQPDMQAIEAKARQYGQMNELAYVVETCEKNHSEDHPEFEECQQAHADLCTALNLIDRQRIPGFQVIADDDLPALRNLCGLHQEQ